MDDASFREQDREWRRRLQGLSLVSEAAIDVDEAIGGLQFLARKTFLLDAKANRAAIMKRYAPTALAGLTSVASAKYDEGTFWPRVGEVTGFELTQLQQQLFADTFRYGLGLLGLARFDTPLRNLGEILMHAGIPLASIGEFMSSLQRRDAATSDLTGIDYCVWAKSMSRATAASKGLDAPSWRFLAEGGDVAADFVDRLLTVLDSLAAATAPEDLPLDSLPSHIAAQIRRLLTTGAVRRVGSRTRAREARMIPRLVFADGMIQVHLPPIEERWSRDITWQLTVAGESWVRRVSAPWPGDPITPTREPLRAPELSVVVRVKDEASEWTLPVVDSSAPLLVFDPKTRVAVPSSAQVPKGRAWVAFPNDTDREVVDALEYDGELSVIEQLDAPYGWDDWSFALLELSQVARLRVRAGATGDEYRWRYVSTITRPAIEDVPAVPFVRAADGTRVLSMRPRVLLPPARLDAEAGIATTAWTITTTSTGGEVLATVRTESSLDPLYVDPWPEETGGLVGEYTIQVQGPLGRGATLGVAIAEGLAVTANPEFRWFEPGGGLEPCTLAIMTPGGAEEVIVLAPDSRERQIAVKDALGAPSLTVSTDVDHMWVSIVTPVGASRPAIGPPRIHREDLPSTEFRLNTIPRAYGRVVAVAGRAEVQSTEASANHTGIVRLNLAGFADTAQKHGVLALRYEAAGNSTTLGLIRPKQLISEVTVVDDIVTVLKNGESVALELGVYMDLAPWREAQPFQVPIGIDSVEAPPSLRGRGSAWVAARVVDPWASDAWPKYPSMNDENSHHIELEVTAADDLEDAFTSWIGGKGPLPEGREALAFALDIYESIPAARTSRPRWELRQEVAESTRLHSWDFIDVARDSNWSRATHTRLIAEGWAATAPSTDRPVNPATWTLSPFLGLLESLQAAGEERLALEDQLETILGVSAMQILQTGNDSHAAVGAFRQEAEIISDWPKARIDAVWQTAAPVPGALLNPDQRMIHGRELFDARLDAVTRDLARTSHTILRRCHAILQAELGERASVPIASRSGSDGWPSLPCLSITLSLLARLSARGSEAAIETFDRYRSRFGDLATAAANFVEQDLVLAELWMTHWENS